MHALQENGAFAGGATAIKCAIYKDTTRDEDVSSTSNVTITNIDAASSFNDAIFSESGGVYTVSEAGVYEIRFELDKFIKIFEEQYNVKIIQETYNAYDSILLSQHRRHKYNSAQYSVVADVNEDDIVNILDVIMMVNILVGGLP